MSGSQTYHVPWWLKPMNKTFLALKKIGIGSGMETLTVVGRRSGKPRTTLISVLRIDGRRYVVGGFPRADWVANVRAAGEGTLATKRTREAVRLVELPIEEARPVLRIHPTQLPDGASIMVQSGVVASSDPEDFAALAGTCPVFRIDSV